MSQQQGEWKPQPEKSEGQTEKPTVQNIYITQAQNQTQKRGGCGMGCLIAILIFVVLGIIGGAIGAVGNSSQSQSNSCPVSNPAWPNC